MNFNSTTTTQTDLSLSDLQTTDAGSIKVAALAGTITINEGDADDTGVIAATSGNILLEARGTGSDVVFNADLESGSGHITVWASDDIDGNADIATTDGTVYLLANNNDDTEGKPADGVNLADGTQINSNNGNVRIVATNESDIYLNDIQAGAGAVSLLAERDILDNNGATINVRRRRCGRWPTATATRRAGSAARTRATATPWPT